MRDGNEQTRDPGTEMSDSPKGREERSSTPPTELPTLGNTEVDPGDGTAMLDSPTEPPDLQEGTTPEMLTDSQEDELEAAELDAEVQDQHDHRLRPPAGVVVLLGSRFLSHTTRS